MTRRLAGLLALSGLVAVPASAQTEGSDARVGADFSIAAGTFVEDGRVPANFLTIDSVSNTRLAGGLTLILRPVLRKRTGAEWDPTLAQFVVRHETFGRVSRRLEAGYLAPPAGLGSLAIRSSVNPTIAPALPYGEGLPRLERNAPTQRLYAPTYPLGAQVSFSATRWDARAGVVDASLLRTRAPFESGQPPQSAQIVVGGGMTPRPGLRIGGWLSHGTYVRADERPATLGPDRVDQDALLVGVESEWAFRWTRIAGEWVSARREHNGGIEPATLIMIEGSQTLTPRWFLGGRLRYIDATDPLAGPAGEPEPHSTSAELTLGYRLTPDVSLRGGYLLARGFRDDRAGHRAGASVVWARRLF
jgi:hypothetical protein